LGWVALVGGGALVAGGLLVAGGVLVALLVGVLVDGGGCVELDGGGGGGGAPNATAAHTPATGAIAHSATQLTILLVLITPLDAWTRRPCLVCLSPRA
jgi:hypothetical protein